MKLIRNVVTLLSRPPLVRDYARFLMSRACHGGERVRVFPAEKLVVGGLSGFSEFHSCARFINDAERQFLARCSGEGVILDIGGNLGIFSLLMARHFPEATIHAFEPNPSTFKAMRSNFARNRCVNAHAHSQAVAEQDAEVGFMADPVNRATTHILLDKVSDSPSQAAPSVRVSCVTLDSFVQSHGIRSIRLLKVDVEGYEDLVFRGADRLLSSGLAKAIYYEVCPELTRRAGFAAEAPSLRLLAHGYRLYALDSAGNLKSADLARINAVALENWVAVRDGASLQ